MLFDSTLRKELTRTFIATLVVILTIVLTMMLIRTLGQAAGGLVAPQDVVLLMGYTALGHLPTMLALSLFIAIVVSLGRMYRDQEMAIWFSSGLSLARLTRPVLRTAWPVLLLAGVLLLWVWPWGNRSSAELRERYEQRSDLTRAAPGSFQSSADGNRVFFVDRASQQGLTANNVFIVTRKGSTESVTSARGAHMQTQAEGRALVLEHGQRSEHDRASGMHTLAAFERYQLQADEASVRQVQERAPKTLDTLTLWQRGAPRHMGELAWRLGLWLACANLVLFGVGLAATHPRRATNWNLLFALLGFIVYFNFINLSQAWVGGGRYALAPTLLVLHGGALSLALCLLWWRQEGAVMAWPRLRVRR